MAQQRVYVSSLDPTNTLIVEVSDGKNPPQIRSVTRANLLNQISSAQTLLAILPTLPEPTPAPTPAPTPEPTPAPTDAPAQ